MSAYLIYDTDTGDGLRVLETQDASILPLNMDDASEGFAPIPDDLHKVPHRLLFDLGSGEVKNKEPDDGD